MEIIKIRSLKPSDLKTAEARDAYNFYRLDKESDIKNEAIRLFNHLKK